MTSSWTVKQSISPNLRWDIVFDAASVDLASTGQAFARLSGLADSRTRQKFLIERTVMQIEGRRSTVHRLLLTSHASPGALGSGLDHDA